MTTDALPHWTVTPDFFVWDACDAASRNAGRTLGPDAFQQQALLAETDDFYVIPDQFGVVSGHLLVLPKTPATSVAGLGPAIDHELTWLLRRVADVVEEVYDSQIVTAEHGECGCATASQAHVHVLPIPQAVTAERLRKTIDGVLERRMVGIERIIYRQTEFTTAEDLRSLIDVDGAVVVGRQLRCGELPDDGPYPAAARSASGLVRPYVYLSGPGVRFVSTCSFRSQFVREVVARATGLPEGSWDRRVHTDRGNMFETFARLAPAFHSPGDGRHGFRARG